MFRFPDVVSSSSLSAVGIYHDLSSTEVSHPRFSQALGSAVILQGVPPRAAFSAATKIHRLAQFDCRCQSCPLAAVPAMRHRAPVFIDIDHLADISWVYSSSLSLSSGDSRFNGQTYDGASAACPARTQGPSYFWKTVVPRDVSLSASPTGPVTDNRLSDSLCVNYCWTFNCADPWSVLATNA